MKTASFKRWQFVEFSDIVAHSAFGPRFSGDLYSETGNVATLRTTDLSTSGEISYDTMPLANIDENRFADHFLRIGDLVISRSGRIGTTAIFRGFSLPVLPGAFLIRFRLVEHVDANFFCYFFNSPMGQSLLKSVARGAAQQNINVSNVKVLQVPLPSKREQFAIVKILNTYDDLIQNNRCRIALLEEAARLLYREWFVHFRFPGHERVKIIDGLPEGWERSRLGDIAVTNRESYQAKNLPVEIKYIDISSVTEGRILSRTSLSATTAPGRARRKIQDGDIIWSNVRPNLRAYALILEPEEFDVVSTGFTVLTASSVPFSWLYMFTTTDRFIGYLINHATGAGYPAVRPEDFERAEVLLPPRILLNSFHERTEPHFRLIKKLDQQNQKLAQARDLLLPRIMNGEIAV